MNKAFVIAAALCAVLCAAPALAGEYMCSYQARISDQDKFNSKGDPVVTGANKSSVAMAIRQDRANFHKFGIRDPEDEGDCIFDSPDRRQRLQNMLVKGQISKRAMYAIRDGNPMISVDVYTDHVDVFIQGEEGWGGRRGRSRVR